MPLHTYLYRLARAVNTANAVAKPSRLPRRAKNVALGRVLARGGVWRRLWGGGR